MNSARKISATKAKQLIQRNKCVLVDVRTPVQFRDGTLPGAINIAVRNITTLGKYPKTTKIVFFGDSDDDPNITTASNYAFQMGFQDIFSLGSKENWE